MPARVGCCSPCDRTDFANGDTALPRPYVTAAFTGSVTPVFRWATFGTDQLTLDNGSPVASGSYRRTIPDRSASRDFQCSVTVRRFPDDAPSVNSLKTGLFISDAYAIWVEWASKTVYFSAVGTNGEPGTGTAIFTYTSTQTSMTLFITCLELPNSNYNVFLGVTTSISGTSGPLFETIYDVGPTGLTGSSITVGVLGVEGGGWSDLTTSCGAVPICNGVCDDGSATAWTFTAPSPTASGADNLYDLVDMPGRVAWGGTSLMTGCCVWSMASSGSFTIQTTDTAAWPTSWTTAGVWTLVGSNYETDVTMTGHLYKESNDVVRFAIRLEVVGGGLAETIIIALYEIDGGAFDCLDSNTLDLITAVSVSICGESSKQPSSHYSWPSTLTITPDFT